MTDDRDKVPWQGYGRGSRYFLAGFMILAGTALFLSNLGILPVRNVWQFWPLIVVGLGISRLIEGPVPIARAVGGLLTFVGSLFLLVNLGVIQIRAHDRSWPISILLIGLGLAMLIRMLDNRQAQAFPFRWRGMSPLRMGTPDGFSDFALMATVKRQVDTADFKGGRALSVLGTLKLDLRHARILDPSQPIQLEVSSVLGEAKVRVPDGWRVRIHGAGILGNYEDKTIPPNLALDAPTLVITGYSILGTVEITD